MIEYIAVRLPGALQSAIRIALLGALWVGACFVIGFVAYVAVSVGMLGWNFAGRLL